MKNIFIVQSLTFFIFVCSPGLLISQEPNKALVPKEAKTSFARPNFTTHSFFADYSYVADAENELPGNLGTDSFSVHSGTLKYDFNIPVSQAITFTIGGAWDYFFFDDVAPNVPVPDQLFAISLNLALNWRIDDNWGFRLSVAPGLYSDFEDLNNDDFNAPALLGLSYSFDRDFIFFFGFRVNVVSETPVLPIIGLRWKFAEKWTFDMLSQNPKLIYQLNEDVQLYGGIDIQSGTFRVEQSFGRDKGGFQELDNTWLDYFELRAGLGADISWKKTFRFQAEFGYMPYRYLEFEDEEKLDSKEGAFYGKLGMSIRF